MFDTFIDFWLHLTEYWAAYAVGIALAVWCFGRLADYYLIKTGKVLDKETYSLDEIVIIKHQGFLYSWSAYRRLDRVKGLTEEGKGWYSNYQKKQRIYSEL